jgi:MFS transporter, VNT family, synaptic vesicle glycoprotein 2
MNFALHPTGIITSSMLWGFLADTKGRRSVILPTLFLASACSVLSSFTSQIWVFMLLRYLTGFFISGPSATIYAYLGEYHNVRNRSRAIMGASFVFGIGCISLPLIAYLVINQEWEFVLPYLDIEYKPWRLFIVVCAMPSLLSGLVLTCLPESPKFLLSQGQKTEALEILKMIYRINTGDKAENFKVYALLEEQEPQAKKLFGFQENSSKGFMGLLRLIYNQTAPLFMPPHLSKTMIACLLQFGIFATSNGMYMFFPDILNRIATYMEENPGKQMKICEILNATIVSVTDLEKFNATSEAQCSEMLDISTYEHSLVLEVLYAIGFALIGMLINALGKLPILG